MGYAAQSSRLKATKTMKSENIVIRLTPEEKRQISAMAEKAGISISRLGRKALLGQKIRARLSERELEVLSHLSDIRGDIVNIQNALNGTPDEVKRRLFKSPDFMRRWLTAIDKEVQYLDQLFQNLSK